MGLKGFCIHRFSVGPAEFVAYSVIALYVCVFKFTYMVLHRMWNEWYVGVCHDERLLALSCVISRFCGGVSGHLLDVVCTVVRWCFRVFGLWAWSAYVHTCG